MQAEDSGEGWGGGGGGCEGHGGWKLWRCRRRMVRDDVGRDGWLAGLDGCAGWLFDDDGSGSSVVVLVFPNSCRATDSKGVDDRVAF